MKVFSWQFGLRNDEAICSLVLVLTAFLIGFAAVALYNARDYSETESWVLHTHDVLERVSEISTTLDDLDVNARNYLLSPTPDCLRDQHLIVQKLRAQICQFDQIEFRTASHKQIFDELRAAVLKKIAVLNLSEQLTSQNSSTIDRAAVAQSYGRMGSARSLMSRLDAAERAQLTERLDRQAAIAEKVFALMAVAGGLVPIVVGILLAFWVQNNKRRLSAENELRQQSENLHAMNSHLERVTLDLLEARDRAQDASKLKSQFLANMSHEIRTPMNGILGMANLLSKTALTDRQNQYVHHIHQAGSVLLNLINDILDFSKIEAGKLEIERIEFDLVSAIEDTCELFFASCNAKGISLLMELSPDMPATVTGDPLRFRQILCNLINNAVKFSNHGNIIVSAEMIECDGASMSIEISVKDDGISMDADELDRLFEPFVQADGSITRKYGGTGLGLSISRALLGLMQGHLSVESAKGHGSLFSFVIPFDNCSPAKPIQTFERIPTLVATGNHQFAEIIFGYLNSWGLRPELVFSCESAMNWAAGSKARNHGSVLIILDGDLPNGQSIIEACGRGAKIVLLTDMDDTTNFSANADVEPLAKPLRRQQLHEITGSLLASPRHDEHQTRSLNLKTSRRRQELILVAEDNPLNQLVAQSYLEELGFDCDLVADGLAAVEAFQTGKYALILMDCQMPKLDGFGATAQIRALESSTGKQIPIVAVTAHAMTGDKETCFAAGMNDYLSKPLDMNKFQNVFDSLLPDPNPTQKRHTPKKTRLGQGDDGLIAANALVDFDELQQRYAQLGNKVLQMFVADTQSSLKKLRLAVNDRQSVESARIAHYMKGSACAACAPQLFYSLKMLEAVLKESNWSDAESLLDSINKQFCEFEKLVSTLDVQPLESAVCLN